MNYKSLLKSKKFKIAVWGTGYIGLSTMVYFAKKKIKCIGYDINKEKIKKINSGTLPLEDLRKWFGFDIRGLVKQNYLKATSNYKNLITKEFLVHFIAIPTEKDGKPYYKPLMSVLNNISKIKQEYETGSNFLKNLQKKLKKYVTVKKLRESKIEKAYLETKISFYFVSKKGPKKKSIVDLKKAPNVKE